MIKENRSYPLITTTCEKIGPRNSVSVDSYGRLGSHMDLQRDANFFSTGLCIIVASGHNKIQPSGCVQQENFSTTLWPQEISLRNGKVCFGL